MTTVNSQVSGGYDSDGRSFSHPRRANRAVGNRRNVHDQTKHSVDRSLLPPTPQIKIVEIIRQKSIDDFVKVMCIVIV